MDVSNLMSVLWCCGVRSIDFSPLRHPIISPPALVSEPVADQPAL